VNQILSALREDIQERDPGFDMGKLLDSWYRYVINPPELSDVTTKYTAEQIQLAERVIARLRNVRYLATILNQGHLLIEKTYLVIKNPDGPNTDRHLKAPAGTTIVWTGGTNSGHESSYGDRRLHWIDLPDYGFGIGAELDIDFEWDVS
jgi:hypothetical protein